MDLSYVFNVILSKMSKETPKIQSELTDLEKVGWTRLDQVWKFMMCLFQCFRDVISRFFIVIFVFVVESVRISVFVVF